MNIRIPAAAACLIGLLAALPTSALSKPKKPKLQYERFEVTIKGGQTNRWSSLADDQAESCRHTTQGSGEEQFTYKTAKPHRLLATTTPRYRSVTFGNTVVAVPAQIRREGYLNAQVHEPCEGVAEGDGGGGVPDAPDCGERKSRVEIELHFEDDTLAIDDVGGDSVFDNCYFQGHGFPDVLAESRGKPSRAYLPLKDIFNSKKKKLVATTDAYDTDDSAGTYYETGHHWEVTFKRLPAGKR